MSESNPGGTPPQNPYGQPEPARTRTASRRGHRQQPYGQPPAEPSPYGQPPAENPYGAAPYGQQPQGYYAQQPPPGPLGDGLDMYGRPLVQEARPGTVTAAGWIALILRASPGCSSASSRWR